MAETVQCPSCKFEISKRDKVCRNCGHNTSALLHTNQFSSKMKDVPQAKRGTPATSKQRSTESRRTG